MKEKRTRAINSSPCDSLGCELDWVWNQLKDKLVAHLWEMFSVRLSEAGRCTRNVYGVFRVDERRSERQTTLPHCLCILLVSSSIVFAATAAATSVLD